MNEIHYKSKWKKLKDSLKFQFYFQIKLNLNCCQFCIFEINSTLISLKFHSNNKEAREENSILVYVVNCCKFVCLQFLIAAALVACVAASHVDLHPKVELLKNDVRADGFDYHMALSNHMQAEASGDKHGNMHGSFDWVDPMGVHVKVSYVANELGYQPSSDMLPTPPPTPEAILKSLEYLKAHPYVEKEHKH